LIRKRESVNMETIENKIHTYNELKWQLEVILKFYLVKANNKKGNWKSFMIIMEHQPPMWVQCLQLNFGFGSFHGVHSNLSPCKMLANTALPQYMKSYWHILFDTYIQRKSIAYLLKIDDLTYSHKHCKKNSYIIHINVIISSS